jgi:hypothetical protein
LLNPPQSKRVPQTDVFCDPFSGWPGWPTSPTSVLPENRERLAQPLNVIFNSIFIACFSSPVFKPCFQALFSTETIFIAHFKRPFLKNIVSNLRFS